MIGKFQRLPADRKRFVEISGIAALVAVVYVAWMALELGGVAVTQAVRDIAQAIVPALSAAAIFGVARRNQGPARPALYFFAAGVFSWALGEGAWTVGEVGMGISAPFPSYADIGYLGAAPFFVAGALVLPTAPRGASARVRAALDATLLAGAVTFAMWVTWLRASFESNPDSSFTSVLAVAYPVTDLVTIGLLVLAFGNARRSHRTMVGILMAAFAAFLVADSAFAYLELHGEYGFLGSSLDAGWLAGFLLAGLAAVWPARRRLDATPRNAVAAWQLAMPWLAALLLVGATIWIASSRMQLDAVGYVMWTGCVGLFLLSQFLAFRDSLGLLARSRRAERQLAERTSLLGQIIGRAPIGIARVNSDLRFIDVNPGVVEMLAAPREVLIGSLLTSYLDPGELPAVRERVEKLQKGLLEDIEVDTEMCLADGRTKWIHRRVSTIRKADGSVDYFLMILDDMSAKHQVELAAASNLAAAERLSRLKSEFMSMVSHEFRTALTGIQGYSEMMSTQDVTADETKEFATDIYNDAQRLNRMITEMLDLDRIETGRVSLHVSSLDLNHLLAECVKGAQMTTAKHCLVCDLDPGVPTLEADSDRITQVVANLLSNAIKYSPNGGEIKVTSRVTGSSVDVAIKDQGPGIPPEFKARIFGRYERYEQAGKPQVVGTGLGLAIAQQIIQLHRGRIWVESTLGQGSEFHFALPLTAAAMAAPAVPESTAARPQPTHLVA